MRIPGSIPITIVFFIGGVIRRELRFFEKTLIPWSSASSDNPDLISLFTEGINKKWDPDDKYSCIIRDTLQETLNEMSYDFNNKWLNSLECGHYKIHMWFVNQIWSSENGTEYDFEAEIFSQERITYKAR